MVGLGSGIRELGIGATGGETLLSAKRPPRTTDPSNRSPRVPRRDGASSLRLASSGFRQPFPRPCYKASLRNPMVDAKMTAACVVCEGDGFHPQNSDT